MSTSSSSIAIKLFSTALIATSCLPSSTNAFVEPKRQLSRQSAELPFLSTPLTKKARASWSDKNIRSSFHSQQQLKMQPTGFDENTGRPARGSDLSAFTIGVDADLETIGDGSTSSIPDASFIEGTILPVMSSSLLVTGSTVGAGMLVLPELAAGPGMFVSSGVMLAAYVMNLISGLAIAEVAINQRESSGQDVPSSFKKFAEENLNGPVAGSLVAAISVFCNSLVLAFDTTKAGQVISSLTGGLADSHIISCLWCTMFLGLLTTQNRKNLSQVASILVMGLFSSFAALLLPGLANVSDPLAVMTSSSLSSSDEIMSQAMHIMPVFITTLVYQNIVPTVTRILDYDRTKTSAAIVLGSSIPLAMYMSWCVAVLGGGIDTASLIGGGASGLFLTIFTMATVGGSSLGCLMSLAEEFEILLKGKSDNEPSKTMLCEDETKIAAAETEVTPDSGNFSFQSVIVPVVISLLAGEFFASDINNALKAAGSFGSPLLYGAIPVAMAWMQRQGAKQEMQQREASISNHIGVVPGGTASLGVLGLGATAFVGSEFVQSVGSMITTTI